MDLDTLQSEVQKLKGIVLEQVTVKETCNSSGECLLHIPDGGNMSLTKLLLDQVKFLK